MGRCGRHLERIAGLQHAGRLTFYGELGGKTSKASSSQHNALPSDPERSRPHFGDRSSKPRMMGWQGEDLRRDGNVFIVGERLTNVQMHGAKIEFCCVLASIYLMCLAAEIPAPRQGKLIAG